MWKDYAKPTYDSLLQLLKWIVQDEINRVLLISILRVLVKESINKSFVLKI